YVRDLGIRTPSVLQAVMNLSGGNQQKVVLAKWLFSDVDILILDEPTRGIDVGAKYEIYLLMNNLVGQGKSIIMISSELPEVLGMSDRVIVINAGRKKGELRGDGMSPESVMSLAIN
ncbi:MAG: ATP-binding cassette domain-containing protein, partial [Rectinemataceae bacterium]